MKTMARWSVKPTSEGVALRFDDGVFPETFNLPAETAWQLIEDIRQIIPARPQSPATSEGSRHEAPVS